MLLFAALLMLQLELKLQILCIFFPKIIYSIAHNQLFTDYQTQISQQKN